ncbi:M12 family metallo-peptidase [Flavobacterium sp. 25HG05S-40]|uniref:M12 family metallo-peptidase n=1 Tax=Flavobacterium sp. 25HG05S-40 TaxID=3458682 RepID=UPI0040446AFE
MKKKLLLILLFCVTTLFAQHKVGEKVQELQRMNADFKSISVLQPKQNSNDAEVNKVVDGATLATLDFGKINTVVTNQYETIKLQIPYQNQTIAVLLYKVNPFAEGFHVDTNKESHIGYQKGVYYRGIIEGQTQSVSSFNFFNGEFNGIISSAALGNIVVGKLNKQNNQTDYIVYSDAKMKVLNDLDCHFKDDSLPVSSKNDNRNGLSDRCVSLYFEVDYNLFTENNSNTTTTTNWMTSVFNNVQTIYANDNITVSLKSIYIWTDQDPYEGIGDSSFAYLNAFSQTTPVFDGDLGQLVGIDEGGLGGVAVTIDGLCSQNNYSYSDVNFNFSTVPVYSWTVQVITHEFGHLLGSRHTHACVWNGNNTSIDGCGTQAGFSEGSCNVGPIPSTTEKGTIMSYCHLVSGVGISFSNGFGPQPAQAILNNVNSSPCLSSDCLTSCPNTVTDITTTNVTPTSVSFTWTDIGSATSWQVAVTPFASSSINWNTVTSNSFTISGLNANAYHKIRVRPLCAELESAIREKVVVTAANNFCSSTPFTDSGGLSGEYTNMESWTRTLTPNNPGLKIRISFSSFDLEEDYDYLYIYDGPDEFYPELTGGLTGNSNPGMFNSTATDGSLTVKFFSDQGLVASGWNGLIICTGTLGVEEGDFLDYSYSPNPTTGTVAIKSKDAITELAVYNVQGQLLFLQKMNELTTNVDLSQFANGTYFFKMKINDREANFKILKM